MPAEMTGRRVPVQAGVDPYVQVQQAGDYCGPDDGKFTGGVPAVWFLLPIARDAGVTPSARSLRHVRMPPHVFTEEPDGTLTIRESIGAKGWEGESGYVWHGYLTAGKWELNKSKP